MAKMRIIETQNGLFPNCFRFRLSFILIFLFVAALLFVSLGVSFGIARVLLGDTSIERRQDWDSGGMTEAFQVTASPMRTLGSLTVYTDRWITPKELIAVMYANGGGSPRALLARGDSTRLQLGAWNRLIVGPFDVTTGASDWIAILGAGGTPYLRASSQGGSLSGSSARTSLATLSPSSSRGYRWPWCPLSAYKPSAAPSKSRGTFYAITGVIAPAVGGSGATVSLSGVVSATTTADGSGNYSFGGLANGRYVITPSHGGYSFSPTSQAVTINDADVTNVNFTATAVHPTYIISGTINPASAGAGATLTLSGAASSTTFADSSGNYSFSELSNGSYTVKPTRQKATFSPVSQAVTIIDADATGVNFTVMTRGTE
jgi:hypothetical protein